jgi:DNA-binding beta-propeller fold protein YncE
MGSWMNKIRYAIAAILLAGWTFGVYLYAKAKAAGPSGYQVVKTIPVAGEGGWDYVGIDSAARRIYVSHATKVVVLDADTYATVGEIADTQGVHGIAVAPDLGRGFTSNGRASTVTIFDLKTLKPIATVNTGKNPDAILYDPASKRVFTFNGASKDATVFGAADGVVAATIPLDGKPEFAASDGKGNVFVNNEDTSELMEIDAQSMKVTHRWSMKPCDSPSGLAIDPEHRRLFAGCENKMIAVVDADSGKVVATPPIGQGVDATAYDPGTGFVLSSNGEGTLTVIKQEGPDKYTVVENVPTKKSARTMGLDIKTHNVVLPAADFLPPKEGERRGAMKPGSFVLLVVAR